MAFLCVCLTTVSAFLCLWVRHRGRVAAAYRAAWVEMNIRLCGLVLDRDEAVETAAVLEAQRDHACDRHERMGEALAETREAMDAAHTRLRLEQHARQRADACIYTILSTIEGHKAA